jgi:hypothetical protein
MRRLLVIPAAILCALLLAGCGNKEDVVTSADTEGIYLDVDHLKYQVQISRYLNPSDIEDKSYLIGLPQSTAQPGGDETWFAVFMRVQNTTDDSQTPANDFKIVDTQDIEYRPIPLDSKINPYAYTSAPIPGEGLLPVPDSAAAENTIQGSLLLFKVKTDSLQNRPLELRFSGSEGTEAVVDLDV